MSNSWENSTGGKKEESVNPKNYFNDIKGSIEYKIGKKLPENKEEIFRNFDALIPKEIDRITFSDKVNPNDKHASLFIYDRPAIKASLERELYGCTMQDVSEYFSNEADALSKKVDKEINISGGKDTEKSRQLDEKKNEIVDLFNQLSYGNLEIPLSDIELKISDYFTKETEKDALRKFAQRLSAEIYKDKPKNEVTLGDIENVLKENESYYLAEDREYASDNFRKVFESLDNGISDLALGEIENNIGWIQKLLKERKNNDLKDSAEKILKKRYGDIFMPAVVKKLEELRNYRKFLVSKK